MTSGLELHIYEELLGRVGLLPVEENWGELTEVLVHMEKKLSIQYVLY